MNNEQKIRVIRAILDDLYQVGIDEQDSDYIRGVIASINAVLEMEGGEK